MTNIVIISHSKEIAEGTQALLNQMAGDVNVIVQGGVDGKIGTSYDHIQALINELTDDALCFYDIGSAEMNLDLAIEMYTSSNSIKSVWDIKRLTDSNSPFKTCFNIKSFMAMSS